ncbi:PqqD family protein [Lactococcus lactis]|mgnify:CR=1 FL=1|jgi:hypothetical protein|uniref:Coenzyme PQQ synthesis protein D (PqqD) n=2 Tax=Lactococcus TaxID=1357 RepID=A0A0V8EDD8_LACLL|nr:MULTISPECIES: PqqD family protein [Lactococcus]KEY62736.1 hypothetical protein U725_01129 [Lactococcus cremoris subsp. cremoris GE214]KSU23902.1 hypothetical protein N42_2719 [Lactococcus lactis subsp. lactis]MDU0409814.1 Coenzyme PQQ synthesis protein D [Lactococcus lactis]
MLKKSYKSQLVKFQGKFMITDTKIVFEVNEIGARIFDLCNGKNSVEDIAKKLSNKYKIEYDEALRDINDYLSELEELQLIVKE